MSPWNEKQHLSWITKKHLLFLHISAQSDFIYHSQYQIKSTDYSDITIEMEFLRVASLYQAYTHRSSLVKPASALDFQEPHVFPDCTSQRAIFPIYCWLTNYVK